MGFFDHVLPEPARPAPAAPEFIELGDDPVVGEPADHYLPTRMACALQVAEGLRTRIMLTGFSVWPSAMTVHLTVFRNRVRTHGDRAVHDAQRAGGLRCGVEFADGTRVTTLDVREDAPPGPSLTVGTGQSGTFRQTLNLVLSEVPPSGPVRVVVAWPDEHVPESTLVWEADWGVLAKQAIEIWPVRPDSEELAVITPPTLPTGLPTPLPRSVTEPEPLPEPDSPLWSAGPTTLQNIYAEPVDEYRCDPDRYEPQPDWNGLEREDWQDLALVRARLSGGADAAADGAGGTAAGLAAAYGTGEVVAELLEHGAWLDAPDHYGRTPIWRAVCTGNAETFWTLVDAGADPREPYGDLPTAGSLALVTPLAPLVENLPGARPLTPSQRQTQAAADRLIAACSGRLRDCAAVVFVAGLDENETVRRFGADPVHAADRFAGILEVPGGVVLTQQLGEGICAPEVLHRLSAGTRVYGLTHDGHGLLSVDGALMDDEDLGGYPHDAWRYRFWDETTDPRCARLAYACARTGLGRELKGFGRLPGRWLPIGN